MPDNQNGVAYQWVAQALVTALLLVIGALAWVAYSNLEKKLDESKAEFRENVKRQENRYEEILKRFGELSGKIHGNTSWLGRLDSANRDVLEELKLTRERTLILEERARQKGPDF